MNIFRGIWTCALMASVICLSACGTSRDIDPSLELFVEALGAPDPTVSTDLDDEYRLGPFDRISVTIFGQKELSVEKAQLDARGQIAMPLIGVVDAGGKTSREVSRVITTRLNEKYLQSPNVTVLIDDAASQRITVFGAVMESGIYTLRGPTTLVQAIALAKGPDNKLANLKQVAVFRQTGGRRSAALFDVTAIRNGTASDPDIFGGDTIIVQSSRQKSAWRELISALPGLGIFAYF